MSVELRAPVSAEDWAAYHDIRKRVLFDARGGGDAYDPTHPDDTAPGNHPLLFEIDGKPVGVVRIDFDLPDAWLRRMAVDAPFQRSGHGRRMIDEIVGFCRNAGARRMLSASTRNVASKPCRVRPRARARACGWSCGPTEAYRFITRIGRPFCA